MTDTPDTTIPLPPESSESGAPFMLQMLQRDRQANGSFRPDAAILISPALRTSGLLLSLPPEDVKNLLFLLTFVTTNGDCVPTLLELSQAMHVSPIRARSRMSRLTRFVWQEKPLVIEVPRGGGMDAFTLSPHLLENIHTPLPAGELAPADDEPEAGRPKPIGSREAVIQYSRECYGRPRAQVEAEIDRQMGWERDDSPEGQTRQHLMMVGVRRDQADALIAQYDLERIGRQLDWLQYRSAKNPPAFLVAAIEGDYEEPLGLRLQQVAEQAQVASEPENEVDAPR